MGSVIREFNLHAASGVWPIAADRLDEDNQTLAAEAFRTGIYLPEGIPDGDGDGNGYGDGNGDGDGDGDG